MFTENETSGRSVQSSWVCDEGPAAAPHKLYIYTYTPVQQVGCVKHLYTASTCRVSLLLVIIVPCTGRGDNARIIGCLQEVHYTTLIPGGMFILYGEIDDGVSPEFGR